jgi:hypothetical protein
MYFKEFYELLVPNRKDAKTGEGCQPARAHFEWGHKTIRQYLQNKLQLVNRTQVWNRNVSCLIKPCMHTLYILFMLLALRILPKDYQLVEAHVTGGEACELWWPLELGWRERKLLAGPPKPERSKGRSQTECSPLVLQVGGWAWCYIPTP